MIYNLQNSNSISQNYLSGLLPQRNKKDFWYQATSCRSNLKNFQLSSENRRIIRKTENFSYTITSLPQKPDKNIFTWVKQLGWDFPNSSIKTIFQNHIFNTLYIWQENSQNIAYAVCYFDQHLSHCAYIFYHPQYSHQDLPIRIVLQTIVDSHQKKLDFTYLGRDHTQPGNFYKRNLPGYEYFFDGNWVKYK